MVRAHKRGAVTPGQLEELLEEEWTNEHWKPEVRKIWTEAGALPAPMKVEYVEAVDVHDEVHAA